MKFIFSMNFTGHININIQHSKLQTHTKQGFRDPKNPLLKHENFYFKPTHSHLMSSPQNTSNVLGSRVFLLGTARTTFPPLRIWTPERLPPAQNEPRWTFFVVSRATKLYVCPLGQASDGAIWVRPILLKSAWKVILTDALKHQWNVRLNSKRGWESVGMTTCLQGFVLHSKREWSTGHVIKWLLLTVAIVFNLFNLNFNQLHKISGSIESNNSLIHVG